MLYIVILRGKNFFGPAAEALVMNVNQSDVHPVISEHIRPQLESVFFFDDNSETRFSDEGYLHSAQGRNAVNVAALCSFFRRLCCADRIP